MSNPIRRPTPYARLRKLFPASVPAEDFFTEILVSTLNNLPDVLEHFCKEFLELQGEQFQISSQETYRPVLEGNPERRPDIVIQSESQLCFLESKLESGEGPGQLADYQIIVKREAAKQDLESKLIYITQFYDPKPGVIQRRWYEVHRFLKKYHSRHALIEIMLGYMEEEHMNQTRQFSPSMIQAMKHAQETLSMMRETLNGLQKDFTPFGTRVQNDQTFRIKDHNDCVDQYGWVLADKAAWNSLNVGFFFHTESDYPDVGFSLWVDKKHPAKAALQSLFMESLPQWKSLPHKDGLWLKFSIPLQHFLSAEDQVNAISEWFLKEADVIRQFFLQHTALFNTEKLGKDTSKRDAA